MGLDLSLNSTGIIILDSNKKLKHQQTVKHKKGGLIEPKLINLIDIITNLVKQYQICYEKPQLHITIEDYVPQATNKKFTLGAVHYGVRCVLFENKIPIYLIQARQLKKFATGLLEASKTKMEIAAKKLGYKTNNDDEADALFLALMGYHFDTRQYNKLKRKQIDALMKIKTYWSP